MVIDLKTTHPNELVRYYIKKIVISGCSLHIFNVLKNDQFEYETTLVWLSSSIRQSVLMLCHICIKYTLRLMIGRFPSLFEYYSRYELSAIKNGI